MCIKGVLFLLAPRFERFNQLNRFWWGWWSWNIKILNSSLIIILTIRVSDSVGLTPRGELSVIRGQQESSDSQTQAARCYQTLICKDKTERFGLRPVWSRSVCHDKMKIITQLQFCFVVFVCSADVGLLGLVKTSSSNWLAILIFCHLVNKL